MIAPEVHEADRIRNRDGREGTVTFVSSRTVGGDRLVTARGDDGIEWHAYTRQVQVIR